MWVDETNCMIECIEYLGIKARYAEDFFDIMKAHKKVILLNSKDNSVIAY